MFIYEFMVFILFLGTRVNSYLIENERSNNISIEKDKFHGESVEVKTELSDENQDIEEKKADSAFDGVYSECFFHLSYTCIQRKTLLYLKEINNLNEIPIFGHYLKFVKVNTTNILENVEDHSDVQANTNSHDLSILIDNSVNSFFDKHVLRINALGKDIVVPRTVEEFVGRKRRKGGGGGGGGGGGHDDGGKKKMMMMAMMCMKMKLMMMVPAMMGMMGMMSFKGMMFSMMSFMISKMMLLMKLLEKKSGGNGGGGGGDGGWAAGGGGGGAWMPAGGQDGGAGGGYDANGQWQSRSILAEENNIYYEPMEPVISSITPIVSYNNIINPHSPVTAHKHVNSNKNGEDKLRLKRDVASKMQTALKNESSYLEKLMYMYNGKLKDIPIIIINKFAKKNKADTKSRTKRNAYGIKIKAKPKPTSHNILNNAMHDIVNLKSNTNQHFRIIKSEQDNVYSDVKSRQVRSIMDVIQNAYTYWASKILGYKPSRPNAQNPSRYKIINGVKYIYYPMKQLTKPKSPKAVQNVISTNHENDDDKILVTAEDFNKGEIVEGAIESRMRRKKFNKMKKTLDDALDDSPWQ